MARSRIEQPSAARWPAFHRSVGLTQRLAFPLCWHHWNIPPRLCSLLALGLSWPLRSPLPLGVTLACDGLILGTPDTGDPEEASSTLYSCSEVAPQHHNTQINSLSLAALPAEKPQQAVQNVPGGQLGRSGRFSHGGLLSDSP